MENITFDQLPRAVKLLFEKLEAIEKLLQMNTENSSGEDELLTVKDTAKFLSLSVPTVYTLISKGEIPVMKRSKRCYFSKLELLAYLKEGRKQTNSERKTGSENHLKKQKRRS